MVGYEFPRRYQRIISSLSILLADATFSKSVGSLIPQPSIDVRGADQINKQAFRVTMTLMVLRITIFKMKEIWRLHAKKDMQKRLASVHSKVRRGSLIPHLHFV